VPPTCFSKSFVFWERTQLFSSSSSSSSSSFFFNTYPTHAKASLCIRTVFLNGHSENIHAVVAYLLILIVNLVKLLQRQVDHEVIICAIKLSFLYQNHGFTRSA